jgi:hypothetical protein
MPGADEQASRFHVASYSHFVFRSQLQLIIQDNGLTI